MVQRSGCECVMYGSFGTLCGAATAPMLAALLLFIFLDQPAETFSWQVSSSLQPRKHYFRQSKPFIPPWKHYSQHSIPSLRPWKHHSKDSKPSPSSWKRYYQESKPSLRPRKHHSQDLKSSPSPWKHYSRGSKPPASPWKHQSQDSLPLLWPAMQSNIQQNINSQIRGKSDAQPIQNSLNRKSLRKRQFLLKSSSFSEQPSVDHARKVNEYFADSRWVNKLSSSAGRGRLNIAAGLRTRQQSQQNAMNSNILLANRYQPSSSASSLQRNDLIYSSYSSYQPIEKQSSSAPLGEHHTNQGQMKKSFKKKVLPFIVVSLLVLGLSLSGMAYVFTLSPPTLVTYSKRRFPESTLPVIEGISLLAWTWMEAQQVWQEFGETHPGFPGECWPWLMCTALRNQRPADLLPSSFSPVVAFLQRLESFIVQTGLVKVVGTWTKHMPCKDNLFCRKRLIHSY